MNPPKEETCKEETVQEAVDRIIASAVKCVNRGPGKGKCHVFLDHSDICQCEDVDLTKRRMRETRTTENKTIDTDLSQP